MVIIAFVGVEVDLSKVLVPLNKSLSLHVQERAPLGMARIAAVRAAVPTAMRNGGGVEQVIHTFFKSFCS